MTDTKPTLGAIKAAQIITGGKLSDKQRYPTEYGDKTVEGVARIIDAHTAAPDLLAALRCVEADLQGATEILDGGSPPCWHKSLAEARAAIAKATE